MNDTSKCSDCGKDNVLARICRESGLIHVPGEEPGLRGITTEDLTRLIAVEALAKQVIHPDMMAGAIAHIEKEIENHSQLPAPSPEDSNDK